MKLTPEDWRIILGGKRQRMPAPWRYRIVTTDAARVGKRVQNGTSIASGCSNLTIVEVMRTFNTLPSEVRRALAASVHDWAPHWAEAVLHGWSAKEVVERLQRADQEEAVKRELELLRGEG
jgi:hypothetical protein